MRIDRDWLEELIFGVVGARRFTQDSPILPDVWLRYALGTRAALDRPVDLLLTPHRRSSANELAAIVAERVAAARASDGWDDRHPAYEPTGLAYNQTTVVVRLFFDELLTAVLPLSEWWHDYVVELGPDGSAPDFGDATVRHRLVEGVAAMTSAGPEGPAPGGDARQAGRREGGDAEAWQPSAELLWLVRLTGALLLAHEAEEPRDAAGRGARDREATRERLDAALDEPGPIVDRFAALMEGVDTPSAAERSSLYLVSVNRRATPAVARSVLAIKADAATRLFDLSSAKLSWAILDSGIDATHPAFRERETKGEKKLKPVPFEAGAASPGRRPKNNTRVVATYDFTRVRYLISPDLEDAKTVVKRLKKTRDAQTDPAEDKRLDREIEIWSRLAELVAKDESRAKAAKSLRMALTRGRAFDWSQLEPLLELPHTDGGYDRPRHDHGTHVAGILAADWQPGDDPADCDPVEMRETEDPVRGVCPDIRLYDLRVLDEHGQGDEFSVMAALQYVRWTNANKDAPVIHGVNLSLSIPHDVANYACGRTPVCDECDRVVANGVVVVAAAGNEGYIQYTTPSGQTDGYRSISITDPGNTESVITVGATHRYHPHTYGVSYFSSRGPTGDGRVKPDLVAPGEKIMAPVPDGLRVKDGTSMAAPHVSGAAALLMSRHRELIGQPARVKRVLCATATDLGRERYFQGSGMLDVLRALQSV